ncbi:MAG: hypothetical protein SFU99_12895 [Saprospiraceae bacterium]|nr:hypothetical protein [Saprospiraceae bacterium]
MKQLASHQMQTRGFIAMINKSNLQVGKWYKRYDKRIFLLCKYPLKGTDSIWYLFFDSDGFVFDMPEGGLELNFISGIHEDQSMPPRFSVIGINEQKKEVVLPDYHNCCLPVDSKKELRLEVGKYYRTINNSIIFVKEINNRTSKAIVNITQSSEYNNNSEEFNNDWIYTISGECYGLTKLNAIEQIAYNPEPYTLKIGEVCEDEEGNRWLPIDAILSNHSAFKCVRLNNPEYNFNNRTIYLDGSPHDSDIKPIIRKSPNQSREIIL